MNEHTQAKLQREIEFLRGLVDRNMAGEAMPGEAFGIGARCDNYVDSPALRARDYCFTITQKGDVLELEVDSYTAIHGAKFESSGFDDEAWASGMIFIDSALPPGRMAYQHLHRAARMLLAGYDVRLNDGTPEGTRVPGIKQGAAHAQA